MSTEVVSDTPLSKALWMSKNLVIRQVAEGAIDYIMVLGQDDGTESVRCRRETIRQANAEIQRACQALIVLADALESTEGVLSDCQQDLEASDGYRAGIAEGRRQMLNIVKREYAELGVRLLRCNAIAMDREGYRAFRILGDRLETTIPCER